VVVSSTSIEHGGSVFLNTTEISSEEYETDTLSSSAEGPTAPTLNTVGHMPNYTVWTVVGENFAYRYQSDGNSTTQLYKAVVTDGVVSETWTRINSVSYGACAYDVSTNKIHWASSTKLYTVDCDTGVQTDITISITSPSTYTKSCATGGYFVIQPNSSYGGCQIINTATGEVLQSSGFPHSAQSLSSIALVKTATHYLLYRNYNTTIMYSKTIREFEEGQGSFVASNTFSGADAVRGGIGCVGGDTSGRLWFVKNTGEPCYMYVSENDTALVGVEFSSTLAEGQS
jgi:hypothetical protein